MNRKDVIDRSLLHKVTKIYSGKRSFYEVLNPEGKIRNVSLQVRCDCEFCSTQGTAHGEICSHILAVLRRIVKEGGIQYVPWTNEESKQAKRNEAMNLLKIGTPVMYMNEVRTSVAESKAHIWAKTAICERLLKENKKFVTEAIFKTSGRADIFSLDDFLAIEIAKTEKPDSLERKKNLYPRGVKMQIIRI